MRASDAERDEAAALLGLAASEGRLDLEELDARTATAYAARTRGELERLLEDIPRAQLSPAAPRAPEPDARIAQWRAPVPRAQAADELLAFVGTALRAHGFELEHRADARLVFGRKRRRWWVQALRYVLPAGVRARLRKREQIIFELDDHDSATVIVASGQAPGELRRSLAAMER